MEKYEIAVVGGGASGLMAAAAAGRRGSSTVLLEGNSKLGKKLLATGNGRCNLTNRNMSVGHYHGDTDNLEKLLSAVKIEEEFNKLGIFLTADSEGRVYPNNLQAAAVLKVLTENCEESGVNCFSDFNVFSVIKSGKDFVLKSSDGREIKAHKVIVATGGMASPKHSSGSDGYDIVKSFGHTVTKMYPVLTQFTSFDEFIKPLSGMRCRARVSLVADNKPIHTEEGEILFADKAVSGICIFGLSVYGSEFFKKGEIGGKKYNSIELVVNLCPNLSREELKSLIMSLISTRAEMAAGDMLSGLINLKVGKAIVKKSGVNPLSSVGTLKPTQIDKIVGLVHATTISVNGVKGFGDAQVTAGGVPMDEICEYTMESKLQKGLYLAGEILNVHGDCGGYNLHFAWATGLIAGQAASDTRIIL